MLQLAFDFEYNDTAAQVAAAVYSDDFLDAAPVAAAQSIFDYVVEHKLLNKLTFIALKQAKIPPSLRDDATQEVHIAWSGIDVKADLDLSQICSYACLAGRHAAMRLRRDLGSVVALPSALFRKTKSLKSQSMLDGLGGYESPLNIEDFRDSAELVQEESDVMPLTAAAEMVARRLRRLTLTKTQVQIAKMILVQGMTTEATASHLDLTTNYVTRQVVIITNSLYEYDALAA
jgi:hypothetical protein